MNRRTQGFIYFNGMAIIPLVMIIGFIFGFGSVAIEENERNKIFTGSCDMAEHIEFNSIKIIDSQKNNCSYYQYDDPGVSKEHYDFLKVALMAFYPIFLIGGNLIIYFGTKDGKNE